MDEEVRDQSKILFGKIGLDMTTAVNMFLIQTIREKCIPFRISTVNNESNEEQFERLSEMKLREDEAQVENGQMRSFESFASEVNSKYRF